MSRNQPSARLALAIVVALGLFSLPSAAQEEEGFKPLANEKQVSAQATPRANLIWFDEGDPSRSVPAEMRYLRRSFTEDLEVTRAELHIACDDEFVLFVNGKEAGRSSSWQDGNVIDLKPFWRKGKNVVGVEATNRGGPAALVAWLVYDTGAGKQKSLVTDAGWKCSKEGAGKWNSIEFDDSKWANVKVIGEFGKIGPWPPVSWSDSKESGIQASGGNADPGRFRVKPGFAIDVIAEPKLTGSLVNMTLDARGRPVVSRENGPILTLDDPDSDGQYRKSKELTGKVTNCQGLLAYDATTFYVVGNGPEGTGLYRLKDTKGTDVYDEVRLIHKFKGGMSEHGPHAVIVGPDGYLYLCCGNMAWVTATPEANSPVEKQYEGDLLPRYEDPSGHAAGIKIPGGTIWRLDPEGKHFALEAAGFRNHFDIAFNSLGELFTFDSDMELQESLPFYHPVRVMHSVPGADFGWRSNDGKWPPYYVDALPAVVDIGRGSPTGLVFCNHQQFPPEYQDALLIGDWSLGRILSVKFRRDGATFKAETEEFVTGKPLNVADIEVAPDGSVFFCTGGRGTEGGVYRIRSTRDLPRPKTMPDPRGTDAVATALDQPQPQSAWGREAIRRYKVKAGEKWGQELEAAAKDSAVPTARRVRALSYLMQFGPEPSLAVARQLTGDGDPEVRAQAAVVLARYPSAEVGSDLIALLGDPAAIVQRRAAEGLVRTGTRASFEKLRPLLAGEDRFARFAGRLALERTDPAEWGQVVLKDDNPRAAIMGLIALNRLGLIASDVNTQEAVFASELRLLQLDLPPQDLLDTLRCLQLTLVNTQRESRSKTVEAIAKVMLARFPTDDRPLDYELARVLAALQVPGAIEKLLAALEKHSTTEDVAMRADAIHYARSLVAINTDWTTAQRRRYLDWFRISRDWNGGHSYRSTIYYFLRDAAAQAPEAEKGEWKAELDRWPRNPFAGSPIVDSQKPAAGWTYDQLLAFVEGDGRRGSVDAGRSIYEQANCAKCHRFEQIGGGFGPDLTTLSSRFNRKDALEAIIYPSRVISDQYRSWLVATKSGTTIHGMKAPAEGDNLVLLLSDASTLKLPKADVDEMRESKQSSMPEGLLNQFSLQQIADLIAFLESGKAAGLAAPGSDKDGFQPLFNGKNLDGWEASQPELWTVKDGMIVGNVQAGKLTANTFLATREKFSDFVLKVSVRLVKDEGNSGIQFRSTMLPNGTAKGYQADIANGFWGLLLEEGGRHILQRPDTEAVKKRGFVKADDWNHYVITAQGHRITLELNGIKCVDLEDRKGDLIGVIAFQLHVGGGMHVQFKDIAIKETAVSLERVATGFRMAEGPVWDGENLIFSDVPPSKIHKLGSDGMVTTIRSDTRWGAGMAFDAKRRLIICEVMGRRVTRVEQDGTETTLAETFDGKKLNGPNDLAVDSKDGIYFTDPLFLNKDRREQDKEAVYYINPEGKILRVADDMERPNGIALDKDGETLFVADTAKSKLRAYPVKDDGTLGEGLDFGSVPGLDGVKVDLDGNVYAAGRNGIAVWDASGKSLGTLKVPMTPNSLAFGDKDRRTMYITTAPSVYKIRLDQALKILTADEK